jgi:hypothetical protein
MTWMVVEFRRVFLEVLTLWFGCERSASSHRLIFFDWAQSIRLLARI